MKRIVFLTTLILIIICSLYSEARVCVAILGDRTGEPDPEVFRQVIEEINLHHPDIVISVGDHIQGYTSDPEMVKQEWAEVLQDLQKLEAPYYLTPGNHDLYDDYSRKYYSEQIGKPHYSFDFASAHFVVLDNAELSEREEFGAEQLNFLKTDLAQNKQPLTFIFFHKPFWTYSLDQPEKSQFHQICKEYKVDGVFSGHYHTYFWDEVDGIRYTTLGSSGGGMDYVSIPEGSFYQYGLLFLEDEKKAENQKPFELTVMELGHTYNSSLITRKENQSIYFNRIEGISFEPLQFLVEESDNSSTADLAMKYLLTFYNPNDFEAEMVLSFETAQEGKKCAWKLNPEQFKVMLEAKGKVQKELLLEISDPQKIYPAPSYKIEFSYSPDKKSEFEKKLPIFRMIYCPQVSEKVTTDGELNEKIYTKIEPQTLFGAPEEDLNNTQWTELYAFHDNENLYLTAVCTETKPDKIFASETKRDGNVWAEDCIEYFLDMDLDQKTYLQLAVNPLGGIFDQSCYYDSEKMDFDPKWNGNWHTKSKIYDHKWVVETAIAFKDLKVDNPKAKDRWGFNFRRKQHHLKAVSDWVVPFFHAPKEFGVLIFQDKL